MQFSVANASVHSSFHPVLSPQAFGTGHSREKFTYTVSDSIEVCYP
uniref:Uncharacterized protein n=1 Tax=Anguilla anguilla TaxID=7936 RepID=A0A0E9QRA4_ANGAN